MPRGHYRACGIQPPAVVAVNHRHAAELGLPWLDLRSEREGCIAIVGGGPSAGDHLEEILAHDGPVMAINGAYGWLLGHGRIPEYMVMGDPDPAPEMAAFVADARPETEFLIASHCDRSVLDALDGRSVVLWRAAQGEDDLSGDGIPGGSSTLTRAPVLALWLGYRSMRLYGADSSFHGPESHAYGGRIPDDRIVHVACGGRVFATEPALILQADFLAEFLPLLSGVEVEVAGDGHLLAALLGSGEDWRFAEPVGAYVPPDAGPARIAEAINAATPSSWRI